MVIIDFEAHRIHLKMTWEVSRWNEVLKTEYIPGVPKTIIGMRRLMIDEATRWVGGTPTSLKKIHMEPCSDGSLVYFEKPGKEAIPDKVGIIKNLNDMRPVVEVNGFHPKNASFTDVWIDLTNIALADHDAFHAVLLLIYRNAFLLDHKKDDEGNLRYKPNQQIIECIAELDREVGNVTSLKSVEKLIRFVDLLNWNEDVKYQIKNHQGKDRIGRIHTSLTCIKIPHDTVRFILDHKRHIQEGVEVDYSLLYGIMQNLMLSGGICLPKKPELPELLKPYLIEEPGEYLIPSVQRTIV